MRLKNTINLSHIVPNSLASKKKIFLLFIGLCFGVITHAQKENYTWYFGYFVGVDFKTTPPTPLLDSKMPAFSGCASVSDANGNILFYSNGSEVFNNNHQIMENGTGLKGGGGGSGSVSPGQHAVIVKKPGSEYIYYLFTVGANTYFESGLYYNIINMAANGGLGEVLNKNIPLIKNNVSQKLVTVKDALGCGFWVIVHQEHLGSYATFHINSAGVSTIPVISKVGIESPHIPVLLKASNDKKKLVSLSVAACTTYPKCGIIELFSFDNFTGKITNPLKIESSPVITYYGASFSPDSKLLYVSRPLAPLLIYQYDVSTLSLNTIKASKETIIHQNSANFDYGDLQLAPDGKIYITKKYFPAHNGVKQYLGVINFPNKKGKSCDYYDSGLLISTLSSHHASYGLPNLIESATPFNLEFDLGEDTLLCENQVYPLDGAQHVEGKFLWSTGDTTNIIYPKKEGKYKLTISAFCGDYTDSVNIKFGKPFKVYLGSDTAFCGAFSHLLNAGKGAKNYLWNTGDTTVSILVNKPNIYAVTVKDSNSCKTGDTIDIQQLLVPKIKLEFDSVNCKYVYISVPPQDSSIKYSWNTGDTGFNLIKTEKGIYSITLSNKFCSVNASINVDKLSTPDVDLGADTSLCYGDIIELSTNDGDNIIWNTGETTKQILIAKHGYYWVTATRNKCSNTDTIWVGPVCDMEYYIPSAFTPNGDGNNEVFKIEGEYIRAIEMKIFDRWGELIYAGEGLDAQWNGTYKSVFCQEGTYMYMFVITGYRDKILRKENISGNITLLR